MQTFKEFLKEQTNFDPTKSFRENLNDIPVEPEENEKKFKELEFKMWDAAEEYVNKTREEVDKEIQKYGYYIFHYTESRQSFSQYWKIGRTDVEEDDLDFETFTVRFSEHEDRYGGNKLLLFWGEKVRDMVKQIVDAAKKEL